MYSFNSESIKEKEKMTELQIKTIELELRIKNIEKSIDELKEQIRNIDTKISSCLKINNGNHYKDFFFDTLKILIACFITLGIGSKAIFFN